MEIKNEIDLRNAYSDLTTQIENTRSSAPVIELIVLLKTLRVKHTPQGSILIHSRTITSPSTTIIRYLSRQQADDAASRRVRKIQELEIERLRRDDYKDKGAKETTRGPARSRLRHSNHFINPINGTADNTVFNPYGGGKGKKRK